MTANRATQGASTLHAAAWMSGWLLLMMVMAVAGREAMRELTVWQVLFLRSVLGLFMLWPLVHHAGGLATLRSARMGQHVARNLVHYAAQYLWFLALAAIPLAQLVAIEFTMPLWATALAVLLLGERMNGFKWAALVLGLIGVVVMVQPWAPAAAVMAPSVGSVSADMGQWLALISALGFGISIVMVKSLTRTDSALQVSFWMLVVQAVLGLLPALADWRWPSAQVWAWMAVVAICGTYSHYCFARAMKHADATVLMPMDFLRVPLSAAMGWALYAERIDLFTVAGVLLILLGNLLNLKKVTS